MNFGLRCSGKLLAADIPLHIYFEMLILIRQKLQRFFMRRSLGRIVAKLDRQSDRAYDVARYAEINWRLDVRQRLRQAVDPLMIQSGRSTHRFFLPSLSPEDYVFQVDAVSNRTHRPYPRKQESAWDPRQEEHATLQYSMVASGHIVVTIYPHASEWGKADEKHYVIDHLRSPWDLCGAAGNARIRSHLKLFLRLGTLSLAVQGPSPQGGRLIGKLSKRNDAYKYLHENRRESRVARTNAEIALGAGLVGGLIASTIIPIAQMYGSEHRAEAAQIRETCATRAVGKGDKLVTCLLDDSKYAWDVQQGEIFSTAHVLIVAIVLALVAVLITKRIAARR